MRLTVIVLSVCLVLAFLIPLPSCNSDDSSDDDDAVTKDTDPIEESIPSGMGRIWGYAAIDANYDYSIEGGPAPGTTVILYQFNSWTDIVEVESVTAGEEGLFYFDAAPGKYVLRAHTSLDPAIDGCSLNGAEPHANDEYYTVTVGDSMQVDIVMSVACSCKSDKGC